MKETLYKIVLPYKSKRRYLYKLYRRITGPIRMDPDFIIIGVQKGGTTSLYNYLIKHPNIEPSLRKEVHFFDHNYIRGFNWYRSFFPTLFYKNYNKYIKKRNIITGEATPYYIMLPHAAKCIYKINPKVKIIILLRNPVDRAYSHYHHEVRTGVEDLTFKEAIEKEPERLKNEFKKMYNTPDYYSFNLQHSSYLERGKYINQLKIWYKFFPENQILILKSDDFYKEPEIITNEVFKFLGLPYQSSKTVNNKFIKYNVGEYQSMDNVIREYLFKYFEPYNSKLYEFLGKNLRWEEIPK